MKVIIVKEVMTCDVSPVAMFLIEPGTWGQIACHQNCCRKESCYDRRPTPGPAGLFSFAGGLT